MNKVIMIGRLCGDVETRSTQSGNNISFYRLAVDRPYKQEGQPTTDFFNCVAFGNNGKFAAAYLKKGVKIAIEGQIQNTSWENSKGERMYGNQIIVDRHEFCEKKSEGDGSTHAVPAPAPARAPEQNVSTAASDYPEYTDVAYNDDDLPF